MAHTTDQHERVLNDYGYPDDLDAVNAGPDTENCSRCLEEYLDELDEIRRFTPIASQIEDIMVEFRDGDILPSDVVHKIMNLLEDPEA